MNHTEHLSSLQSVYEMALAISFANDNKEVLCVDFLPWADILVSACCPPGFRLSNEPEQVHARWAYASQHLWAYVSSSRPQRRAAFAVCLGGIEYWHTSLRGEAHRDRGPFRFVIECHNPLARIMGVR